MFFLFTTLLTDPDERPADEDEVQELIRRARVGNSAAARRLYNLHVTRVFRAVRPLCSGEAEAEDATQDAFVDALSNLARYEPRAGTRFIGWLLTLALNRARKRKARADRVDTQAPEELVLLADSSPSGLSLEDTALRKRALLRALGELPERDRNIVCLRYGAELSAEEVEEVTGVGRGNVRKICERRRGELLGRLTGRTAEARP